MNIFSALLTCQTENILTLLITVQININKGVLIYPDADSSKNEFWENQLKKILISFLQRNTQGSLLIDFDVHRNIYKLKDTPPSHHFTLCHHDLKNLATYLMPL